MPLLAKNVAATYISGGNKEHGESDINWIPIDAADVATVFIESTLFKPHDASNNFVVINIVIIEIISLYGYHFLH